MSKKNDRDFNLIKSGGKLDKFIYGERKTSTSLLDPILEFSEEELTYVHNKLLDRRKQSKKWAKSEPILSGNEHVYNIEELLQRFYELKPEYKGKLKFTYTIEENIARKKKISQDRKKEIQNIENKFNAGEKKQLLGCTIIILIIILFIISLFDPDAFNDDPLTCKMINGEKVCYKESEWKAIDKNFEESAKKYFDDN